ncbi:hypothetical protein FKM82_019630 [Ascaphus truei]
MHVIATWYICSMDCARGCNGKRRYKNRLAKLPTINLLCLKLQPGALKGINLKKIKKTQEKHWLFCIEGITSNNSIRESILLKTEHKTNKHLTDIKQVDSMGQVVLI